MKEHLIRYLYILVLKSFILSQTKNPVRAPTSKLPDSSKATKKDIVKQETSRSLEYICS